MDLSWASFWEASWSDFGKVFGGQDAPKTAQDDAKMAMMTSFFGSIFWWMLHVILDGCLGACWGRLGVRLGTSWGVLGALSSVCVAILEVLDGLG